MSQAPLDFARYGLKTCRAVRMRQKVNGHNLQQKDRNYANYHKNLRKNTELLHNSASRKF